MNQIVLSPVSPLTRQDTLACLYASLWLMGKLGTAAWFFRGLALHLFKATLGRQEPTTPIMELAGGWSFQLLLHVQFNSEYKEGGLSSAQRTGCLTCSPNLRLMGPGVQTGHNGRIYTTEIARAKGQGSTGRETLFGLKANR